MRDVLIGARRMIATAWRVSPGKTLVALALMVLGGVAAPLLAAALAWMTSEVVAGRAGAATLAGVVVALLAVATTTFEHLAHVVYFELSELAELDFDEELIALANGSPGIAHHERAEHADTLTVLQREGRQFSMGLEALLRGIGLALAMLLTGVLLARLNPALLLLPLAAVPPLLAGRWAERVVDRSKTATAEPTRAALNLFNLCTSPTAAAELRLFRLQREIRRRHAALWDTVTRGRLRADTAATWLRAAGQVIFALAYIGAVLLVVREAIAGRRGVADVILVLALAAQVNQQVTSAVALLQDLQRTASMYRRLNGYREVVTAGEPASADAVGTGSVSEPAPADQLPPDRLRHGIALERVAFTYPGTDAPVLREVNLTLPAGSTVALVGENGAGKSTLVKLLCGFYQPSAGRVLIDGVDLRRLPVDRWRAQISVGLQDFVRYEFRARHAVGVGDLAQIGSEPAVRAALDRADATDLLDRLPAGLHTQLGMSYNDGAELSGGQWQKVALGRAFMRERPLLLVLDEPTSALDPEAEHALFERYAAQVKRVGRASGAIAVLVSHRFSTVRMADVIIVVKDGRVVETGDHATLAASGGLYAELFAIHEKAYR